MTAEMKNPIEALIGQEEETSPESRAEDPKIENSYEKTRESGRIVHQMQPNNRFSKKREQRTWEEGEITNKIIQPELPD